MKKEYEPIWIDPVYKRQPKNNKKCINCGKKLQEDLVACIKPNGKPCWEFTNLWRYCKDHNLFGSKPKKDDYD